MHPYIYPSPAQAPDLDVIIQTAKSMISRAKAPATVKAYRNDWRDFESWCCAYNLPSLPSTPELVCLYHRHSRQLVRSGPSLVALHP